jgi:uncharacterized protein YbjQ (UPF0145 family)
LITFKEPDKNHDMLMKLTESFLKIRRKLGKKVMKMGGNAVICYRQEIDYEGERTKKVTVRGYGTATFLSKPGTISEGLLKINKN